MTQLSISHTDRTMTFGSAFVNAYERASRLRMDAEKAERDKKAAEAAAAFAERQFTADQAYREQTLGLRKDDLSMRRDRLEADQAHREQTLDLRRDDLSMRRDDLGLRRDRLEADQAHRTKAFDADQAHREQTLRLQRDNLGISQSREKREQEKYEHNRQRNEPLEALEDQIMQQIMAPASTFGNAGANELKGGEEDDTLMRDVPAPAMQKQETPNSAPPSAPQRAQPLNMDDLFSKLETVYTLRGDTNKANGLRALREAKTKKELETHTKSFTEGLFHLNNGEPEKAAKQWATIFNNRKIYDFPVTIDPNSFKFEKGGGVSYEIINRNDSKDRRTVRNENAAHMFSNFMSAMNPVRAADIMLDNINARRDANLGTRRSSSSLSRGERIRIKALELAQERLAATDPLGGFTEEQRQMFLNQAIQESMEYLETGKIGRGRPATGQ